MKAVSINWKRQLLYQMCKYQHKGTGNMKKEIWQKSKEHKIFPAIDPNQKEIHKILHHEFKNTVLKKFSEIKENSEKQHKGNKKKKIQ